MLLPSKELTSRFLCWGATLLASLIFLGPISAEELFSYIRPKVIERSPNNQVPQYGEVGQTGDEGGEFIFIRKN